MRFYHPKTAAWIDRGLGLIDRLSDTQLLIAIVLAVILCWAAFGLGAAAVLS